MRSRFTPRSSSVTSMESECGRNPVASTAVGGRLNSRARSREPRLQWMVSRAAGWPKGPPHLATFCPSRFAVGMNDQLPACLQAHRIGPLSFLQAFLSWMNDWFTEHATDIAYEACFNHC